MQIEVGMANIVRQSSAVSVLNSDVDNFYGTLRNISATADNTAAIAASTAAIEHATAATAQNTAQMVYEQIETNIKLDQSLQFQNLQVQLAVTANEELRSIDSAVRVLGQTFAEVGADLKAIGNESNTLLKQGNDLLGQSLGVQTELLKTMRAEHARLEQDRKAKRLIYELEHVLERVNAEPIPLVRAYAASLMLHQTGAARFSVDDIFEVSDKRLLDGLRGQMRAVIDGVGDEAKAELSKFDEACGRYFRCLAVDVERNFVATKRILPLLPGVASDEPILPPFVGERAMDAGLAAKLNSVLASLHEKGRRSQRFRLIAALAGAVPVLCSLTLVFAAPILGLSLLVVFGTSLFILLAAPLGLRIASSMTGIDMNPSAERGFLADLGITEAGAVEALEAWAEHLRHVQALRTDMANDAALVRKKNEQVRQSNAAAKAWNQRRSELLVAVQDRHKRNLRSLRSTLETFLAKYPTLRQWWALPEESAV
jgi:hypothetical protein